MEEVSCSFQTKRKILIKEYALILQVLHSLDFMEFLDFLTKQSQRKHNEGKRAILVTQQTKFSEQVDKVVGPALFIKPIGTLPTERK